MSSYGTHVINITYLHTWGLDQILFSNINWLTDLSVTWNNSTAISHRARHIKYIQFTSIWKCQFITLPHTPVQFIIFVPLYVHVIVKLLISQCKTFNIFIRSPHTYKCKIYCSHPSYIYVILKCWKKIFHTLFVQFIYM